MKRFFLICAVLLAGIHSSGQELVKKGFKGYKKLQNDSYLKYEKKGKGTTTAEVGGAIFIKICFLADADTVFINVNESTGDPSYPLRVDSAEYKDDFLDILSILHVGDSIKLFTSLDTLHKYFPGEFVFSEPWNSMKYLGMAIGVDSIYTASQVDSILLAESMKARADSVQLIHDDSVQLAAYLKANNFNPQPDGNGIWYRSLKSAHGDTVVPGDHVTVKYKCSYPDGKVLAEELQYTYQAETDSMIAGWEIALSLMHAGEEALFIVPSPLGYNDGHTLIFEVKIWEIEQKKDDE